MLVVPSYIVVQLAGAAAAKPVSDLVQGTIVRRVATIFSRLVALP